MEASEPTTCATSCKLSFVYFSVAAALRWLGSEFEDAARISGARGWRAWLSINAPLLLPAILAAGLIAFAEALSDFGTAATIAQNANVTLVTYQIYSAINTALGQANMFSGEIIEDLSREDMISLRLEQAWVISGRVRTEVSSRLNGHAMLFCRPDDVRILPEEQPAGRRNIVPGIILHASFVGGRWRTLVKYGEKQEHTVLAFATTQPTLNAKVWLELPPELCQIVPA